jgi:hypothetical protein
MVKGFGRSGFGCQICWRSERHPPRWVGDSRKWSVVLSLKVSGLMLEFVFAGFPPNGPFRNSILLASFRYFERLPSANLSITSPLPLIEFEEIYFQIIHEE